MVSLTHRFRKHEDPPGGGTRTSADEGGGWSDPQTPALRSVDLKPSVINYLNQTTPSLCSDSEFTRESPEYNFTPQGELPGERAYARHTGLNLSAKGMLRVATAK